MYTSGIQHHVRHSEAAKMLVNCVSRDNNNQHAHGTWRGAKRAKRAEKPVETSMYKCTSLLRAK